MIGRQPRQRMWLLACRLDSPGRKTFTAMADKATGSVALIHRTAFADDALRSILYAGKATDLLREPLRDQRMKSIKCRSCERIRAGRRHGQSALKYASRTVRSRSQA
jgi:hypothetical protein